MAANTAAEYRDRHDDYQNDAANEHDGLARQMGRGFGKFCNAVKAAGYGIAKAAEHTATALAGAATYAARRGEDLADWLGDRGNEGADKIEQGLKQLAYRAEDAAYGVIATGEQVAEAAVNKFQESKEKANDKFKEANSFFSNFRNEFREGYRDETGFRENHNLQLSLSSENEYPVADAATAADAGIAGYPTAAAAFDGYQERIKELQAEAQDNEYTMADIEERVNFAVEDIIASEQELLDYRLNDPTEEPHRLLQDQMEMNQRVLKLNYVGVKAVLNANEPMPGDSAEHFQGIYALHRAEADAAAAA